MSTTYDEAHHPRWPKGHPQAGRWRPKAASAAERGRRRAPARESPPGAVSSGAGEGGTATSGRVLRRLRRASADELLEAFHEVSTRPPSPATERALARIFDELGRREGEDLGDDERGRAVDRLVAEGASFAEAYAEVHGLDVAELSRQERMQLVDGQRRPGERRDTTIRRMYAEATYLEWLQAEEATRGNLLNRAGRAKGIDPVSLWSGPSARARKYASDELKQWWEDHGGRRTLTQYRAQFTGDRRGAQAARLAGSGRDFGV